MGPLCMAAPSWTGSTPRRKMGRQRQRRRARSAARERPRTATEWNGAQRLPRIREPDAEPILSPARWHVDPTAQANFRRGRALRPCTEKPRAEALTRKHVLKIETVRTLRPFPRLSENFGKNPRSPVKRNADNLSEIMEGNAKEILKVFSIFKPQA